MVTASGMAAVTVSLLALVPPGGTVLAPFDCYGGSWRLFDALERTGRLKLRLADFSDAEGALAEIAEGVDMVWLETPSNPLLRITDIAAVTAAAHVADALVVADNTFATPVVQRPLSLGADVVVHSATKYLNGHSDVVAGAIVAADAERLTHLAWWANTLGVTGGALDSYLTLRGLRTLHLRMAQSQPNAEAVVGLPARASCGDRRALPGTGVASRSTNWPPGSRTASARSSPSTSAPRRPCRPSSKAWSASAWPKASAGSSR